MTTPHNPRDSGAENGQEQADIRELLGSLPDPGPMPDDVMNRISAALEQEQQTRVSGETDRSNVAPLVGRTSDSATSPRLSSSQRRARWLQPVAAIGAAAAIGVGALAGYNALSNNTQAPMANPPASSGQGNVPLSERVSIQNSGRDYTRKGLATEAVALKKPGASTAGPTGSGSEPSLLTPEGLLSCMQDMTGMAIPERISADLGTFEGKPAVIVVVTNDGKSQAWVVSRTCSNGNGKIAGPTAVA